MTVGDWNLDPTVKKKGWATGGQPPEGHLRRCQGKRRRYGDQCTQWARRGRSYCRVHGGNLPMGTRDVPIREYYTRRSGSKFKKLLAALEGDERMDLSAEVDLARVMCERSVHLYEITCISPPEGKTPSARSKALATENLRTSLNHVSDMVKKLAAVSAVSSTTIPVERLTQISTQLANVLARHLSKDHPTLYEAIVKDIEAIHIVPSSEPNSPQRTILLALE